MSRRRNTQATWSSRDDAKFQIVALDPGARHSVTRRLRRALGALYSLYCVDDVTDFFQSMGGARVGVVVGDADLPAPVPGLLRQQVPPLVVVGEGDRRDEEAESGTLSAYVRATIPMHELDLGLGRTVLSVVVEDLLATVRVDAAAHPRLRNQPHLSRAILRCLALSHPPIRSVKSMAHHLQCSERSLQREWRRFHDDGRPSAAITLKEFLTAVIYLRVLHAWLSQAAPVWARISEAIGISPDTCARYVQRWAGRTSLSAFSLEHAQKSVISVETGVLDMFNVGARQ